MMLLLFSLIGCGPTVVEACVEYLEARCACGACDGYTDETRIKACAGGKEAGDITDADTDFFLCQIEVLQERGNACRRDTSTAECADLQGGEE